MTTSVFLLSLRRIQVKRLCSLAAMLIVAGWAGVHAQQTPTGCLSASGDRVIRLSGRIIHVQIEHPLGHYKIEGYGLALATPMCFDTTSSQTNKPIRLYIDQIGLSPIFASHSEKARERFWDNGKNRHRWDDMDRFVRDNVGKTMTVVGTIEDDPSPDQLVSPQIAVGWYAACEIAPKPGMEKC